MASRCAPIHHWNLSSCDWSLQNIPPYMSTHLFYGRDSASLTSVKLMFNAPQLNYILVNSVYYRLLIIAHQSAPFILCISTLSCFHFCIRQLSTIITSIYLWTLTIKFIFVCHCICFYSPLLWQLRWSAFYIERLRTHESFARTRLL